MTLQALSSVRIETSFGEIAVDLDAGSAPITTIHMLRMIDERRYDGGIFHRTVRRDNQSNANLRPEQIGAGIDPAADRPKLPDDTIAIEVIQAGINPQRRGSRRSDRP